MLIDVVVVWLCMWIVGMLVVVVGDCCCCWCVNGVVCG